MSGGGGRGVIETVTIGLWASLRFRLFFVFRLRFPVLVMLFSLSLPSFLPSFLSSTGVTFPLRLCIYSLMIAVVVVDVSKLCWSPFWCFRPVSFGCFTHSVAVWRFHFILLHDFLSTLWTEIHVSISSFRFLYFVSGLAWINQQSRSHSPFNYLTILFFGVTKNLISFFSFLKNAFLCLFELMLRICKSIVFFCFVYCLLEEKKKAAHSNFKC